MPSAFKDAKYLVAALLLVSAGNAAAQQVPQRVPPPQHLDQPAALPPDAPQSTTASYDDWVVQCQTQTGPPAQKVCDMSQVTQVQAQGRSNPFTRVAVAHPVKGQPVKLVVQVPVNVDFATKVHVQMADADPGLTEPFARCVPAGCFADFDINEEVLKKLRAAAATGKISFADAGGHDISVPLSLKGFNQAYDALAKE